MQIRLTVVDPLGPPSLSARARAASCDVLVTAPAGTALAAVSAALASAVSGSDGPTALYAGVQRLDAQRCTLGEPPLIDGAVLSVGAPLESEAHPEPAEAPTQLHVVSGPDAGGVHLLHGGEIRVGRSADADVALDDPDVSRLHCAVTVGADGRVAVADLGSTNGTLLDGTRVTDRPVRFAPGALLRVGESTLRLATSGGPGAHLDTAPDGEGHVRVPADADTTHARVTDPSREGIPGPTEHTHHAHGRWRSSATRGGVLGGGPPGTTGRAPVRETPETPERAPGYGDSGAPVDVPAAEQPTVPGQGWAPWVESHGPAGGVGEGTGASGGSPRGPVTGSGAGCASRSGYGEDGRGGAGTADSASRTGSGTWPGYDEDSRGWASDGTGAASGSPGGPVAGSGVGSRPGDGEGGWAGVGPVPGSEAGYGAIHGGRLGGGAAAGSGARTPGDAGTPDPFGPGGGQRTAPGAATGSGDAQTPRDTRPRNTINPDGTQRTAPSTSAGDAETPHDAAAPDTFRGGTQRGASGGAARDGVGAREVNATAGREGTPVRGTDVPHGVRRRGGLSAWARRLTGGRAEQRAAARDSHDDEPAAAVSQAPPAATRVPETWPDPAALLLTALGPGPRLWERGPGHPEALAVRLGTADRTAPDGSRLPAVPVTAGLREVGALGLAGPRTRLAGLTRTVLAQLAALHSPDTLEIVLITADRSRPMEERTAEWSWLGWLPHLRPGHGQDCRLLLAYDRDQATARTDELLRRLEDHLEDHAADHFEGHHPGTGLGPGPAARSYTPTTAAPGTPGPGHDPTATAEHHPAGTRRGASPAQPHTPAPAPGHEPAIATPAVPATPGIRAQARPSSPGSPHRPSWSRTGDGPEEGQDATATADYEGPRTVLVVDGDPGGADVREVVARLAWEGPRAGIHVLCLAETSPASPESVTDTYEAACAASPVFRECGAVALLSGDVATALQLLRVAPAGGPVGTGTVGTVDAVSLPWAERFARALAPLRTDGGAAEHARVSAPLPPAARLLDELGLARATPASLMARWAAAADDPAAQAGRACAVLGAGPRGPVGVDLTAEGPHLLIEGPPGSGRTELLRAVVASLAAAERPDRLGIVLVDGRGTAGTHGGHGEGLRVATDVPHVTTHLSANDPVRMREFAQSLSAELKRRAELLGRADFTEWHTSRELSGRMVAQRTATATRGTSGTTAASATSAAAPTCPPTSPAASASAAPTPDNHTGDLETPPSATIRLRPNAAARQRADAAPPLPRLVVVVDDLDALVSPALGSPGRPAAGSVMRALESVAREGERLGVHLVAASAADGRTAESEPARRAGLRVMLDAPVPGPEEPAPGRGSLASVDGRLTPFQGGRVTGRIPRTATLRPTVVPLEWHRMGDPPAKRPVRELGNGPTDLALLASALERAARQVAAAEVPSLL